jgi:hypothetical protein
VSFVVIEELRLTEALATDSHFRIAGFNPCSPIELLVSSSNTTLATSRSGSCPNRFRVLTLNDDEKLVAYAKKIHRELRANGVRAEATSAPTRSK